MEELPREIVCNLLLWLTPKDLAQLQQTSKAMCDMANDNYVWKLHFHQKFGEAMKQDYARHFDALVLPETSQHTPPDTQLEYLDRFVGRHTGSVVWRDQYQHMVSVRWKLTNRVQLWRLGQTAVRDKGKGMGRELWGNVQESTAFQRRPHESVTATFRLLVTGKASVGFAPPAYMASSLWDTQQKKRQLGEHQSMGYTFAGYIMHGNGGSTKCTAFNTNTNTTTTTTTTTTNLIETTLMLSPASGSDIDATVSFALNAVKQPSVRYRPQNTAAVCLTVTLFDEGSAAELLSESEARAWLAAHPQQQHAQQPAGGSGCVVA
eukprot:TRINITY_DN2454_c0_g1_i1.p1 TRINITY_DN2454_c0_g1~~TRINITY_DN2454_c0_g1_i1.p1  ORF type:complete len:320 (-),score=74.02 TRINITY_DN2454_c0_g1_i1:260-1219(-)